MKLDKNDYKRFEKQIILKKIGFSGQKKINNAKVLIIGMGGLGCPLLTYLASSGVCNIGIVDYDKVELGNLNRQILFNTSDVGKFKVNQAKSKICKIYKKIKIKTFNIKISKKNINSIIKNFDIICDGTDNFKTRYLINDYCKKIKKFSFQLPLANLMAIYLNIILKKKDLALDVLCLNNLMRKTIVKRKVYLLL